MSFPKDRETSRKRLMRNARDQIDEGLENQRVRMPAMIAFVSIQLLMCIILIKVATDAAALIKHYKALLLS